jgi:hypothetical protein
MADVVVNRRVNIYIDETAGAVALERLTKKENELVAAIEKGKKSGKDLTKEMNLLAETRNKIGQIKDVMDGKVLPSVRQAEAAVGRLRRELRNLPADSEAAGRKLQELKKAESTLIQVKNAVNGVDNSLKNVAAGSGFKRILEFAGGAFLGGGALGIVQGLASGVKDFFTGAVEEALAAEEATARFRAQLDNLGRLDVFERLSRSAENFADQFQSLDNDEIIVVFEQLINYGKLTEKQINELTPVIIDFAAKQRISLSEATGVVVKALEGNGKALKEYGIDIKDAKNETEAFGVIMTQLKPKVEGAMATYEQTTAGALARTRQSVADLKEEVGTGLLPVLKTLLEGLKGFIDGIPRYFDQLNKQLGTLKTNVRDGFNFLFNPTQFAADQAAKVGIEYAENIKRSQEIIRNTQEQYFQEFLAADKQQRIVLARRRIAEVKGLQVLLTEAEKAGAKDRVAEYIREINIKNEYLRKFTQALRTQDTQIGTGGSTGGGKTGDGKVVKAKDTVAELEKKYQEFANRTEEATAPILSAFRKINEAAKEDIQTVNEALKANIITPEEAQKSLDLIERVLNQQREALQKKFGLGESPLGPTPIDIPVEQRFDKDTELGAKELGKKIGEKIQEGVDEVLKGSSAVDPVKNWLERNAEEIDQAFQIANELTDLFINIGEVRGNAEQAAFDREVANNDKRKESAKKLYEAKLISQKEYDRRVAQIDKQQEAREKELRKRQFERDKNAATAQAIINGAGAQLTTLLKFGAPIPPNFLGIAANALTLALTAANIVAIRTQKPPEFGDGGFVPQGSSHKQGGIALVDNRTGATVGEVEGGEPIISKKVYALNKPLIDSLISRGSGMSMNIPRLNNSFKTVYETGGFIPSASGGDNSELLTAINNLNVILSKPLRSNVIFGEYEEKADLIDNIRAQSMVS